jgi:hypothetical protein
VDDYRDYEKALLALKESLKYAIKAPAQVRCVVRCDFVLNANCAFSPQQLQQMVVEHLT